MLTGSFPVTINSRTTRSKLTEEPKAEVMLYFQNSQLDEIYVYSNDSAETTCEHIGVLDNFQGWENPYSVADTAEVLEMADGYPNHSYTSSQKRQRRLNVNENHIPKTDRDALFQFHLYHGISIPFLFIDRTNRNHPLYTDQKDFWWARFNSPFPSHDRRGSV